MIRSVARRVSRIATAMTLRAAYFSGPQRLQALRESLIARRLERSLDLGCGPVPRNEFAAKFTSGVDIRGCGEGSGVLRCDLAAEDLPFEDESFDCITAYDVLEHIPRIATKAESQRFAVVELMNEIWRVLRMDGVFFSSTPCFPMRQAFQDPTHVNIMTEDTLRLYFGESAWARIYGFEGSFALEAEGWSGSHYWCLLRKSASHRIADQNSPQEALR